MNERGFTLVELLVTTAMALVVFALVGTTLVAFQNDHARSTRQNDSQDQVRTAIDRIVRQLRNVAGLRSAPSLIEGAGPSDLVFQTIGTTAPAGSSQNKTGVVRVRYCIPPDPAPGSAGNHALFAQTETWTTAAPPANPWPVTGSTSTSCPFTPGSLPGGASVATTRLAENVTNRIAGANRPAFTYDSGTLSAITSVGIGLFVDVSTTQAPAETSLRSAAFLRNQNQAPVAAFTPTATGGGHVLLNGGGSSDPDGQQLTYQWFKVVGTTTTPIGTTGLLDWAPGAGSYSVRLLVTDPGGLNSTLTKTVAVS